MYNDFTIDELLLTIDILRSMLDESEAANRMLLERVSQLETILKNHRIPIPDYDTWHSALPIA